MPAIKYDIICEQCGTPFQRALFPSQSIARFCSRSCAAQWQWKGHKKTAYAMITAPGHPLETTPKVRIGLHRYLLYNQIGPGPHVCHWCGCEISWMLNAKGKNGSLCVDHIDGDFTNNAIDNLVPACNTCNTWRNREDWIKNDENFVISKNGTRHRAERRICQRCGTEFLFVYADKRPNRGRFCSRPCAAWSARGKHQ